MKALILLLMAVFLTGCASFIPSNEWKSVNFGNPPANYQDQIRSFMSGQLKDPYSAIYSFDPPRKTVVCHGYYLGGGPYGQRYYGWAVPTLINAKNSFGGYTGNQYYVIWVTKGYTFDITPAFNSMDAKFVD